MIEIEAHECRLLTDFLGENWQMFTDFAVEMGYGEDEADGLFEKLEKKSNE